VLARAGGAAALDPAALRRLTSDREQAVVRALMQMPGELARAVAELDPSKVALATYEVARAFNQLYTDKDNHPIVGCEDAERRAARLLLTDAVGAALSAGLYLLGIDALEQM
jgi:arginyl-tRNA synthetase